MGSSLDRFAQIEEEARAEQDWNPPLAASTAFSHLSGTVVHPEALGLQLNRDRALSAAELSRAGRTGVIRGR